MFYIGCHLSSAKGFLAMAKDAERIGATTFQFFTRNPRGGSAKKPDPKDIAAFLKRKEELGLGPLIAHPPYTLNAASDKPEVRDFAFRAMSEDLERLELVPGNYYNFHPGSHVGQGSEEGIRLIAGMLNEILTPKLHTTVLLETMAGKGSEIGGRFEELSEILSRTKHPECMGVCLDTCHVWDGGYDIKERLEEVLSEFDRIIGLSKLKAVHLNDSMNPLGARKDRHAKIGEGFLGLSAMGSIINHPALKDLPFCLETPNELSGYAGEIALLKTLRREPVSAEGPE